ncbi:MAG: hypothetical protein HQL15_03875 [Candidatus Omnitrophica bacterium]|nr:hypothetical protein [Candidatus Omnitrophota bacterium]
MRKAVLILLILCAAFNVLQLTLQILGHQIHPSTRPFHSLGDQFKGLEVILGHERTVGYYTDKNMDNTLAIAQFEQAQYLLAPTVLDLNQTNHPFVLFDCTSAEVAINKIKELGLQPLKANNTGIVLAINPQLQNLKP